VPPKGRYWADPFVVDHGGVSQLYFEDFDLTTEKGRISTGRLTKDGIVDVHVAVEPPYHVSYPFLQVHEERLYMVPESYQSGNVELWECVQFPHVWEKRRNLLEGVSAVDSTLLQRDGRWWLFTGLDRTGYLDHGDELHLYVADDLLRGEFRPHPANPIITDARTARMGGPFVTLHDGTLLRMAQRGGQSYGSGLRMLRVDELDESRYRETLVEEVGANWRHDAVGIHHCCVSTTYSVFDACIRVPKYGRRARGADRRRSTPASAAPASGVPSRSWTSAPARHAPDS
jgi:hypothetical protein